MKPIGVRHLARHRPFSGESWYAPATINSAPPMRAAIAVDNPTRPASISAPAAPAKARTPIAPQTSMYPATNTQVETKASPRPCLPACTR